jgi:hypothetical protein
LKRSLDEVVIDAVGVSKEVLPQERLKPRPKPQDSLLQRLAVAMGDAFSSERLAALLRSSLGDLRLALCLHRVRGPPFVDSLNIPPQELDALLGLLLRSRQAAVERWLTLCFDDGYLDAAQYISSRAPRHPQVEWLCFVCPRRAERRSPFSWDDPAAGCQLATVDTLRSLARLPNVWLGNHSNAHLMQTELTHQQVEHEYRAAFADFGRLFGVQRHFAFPFGTPELEFDAGHVALLRSMGEGLIWSTERRPFDRSERRSRAVLPRFPIDGSWSHKQTALWIALLTLKFRVMGASFSYEQ